MELPEERYNRAEDIETARGNRVSRRSVLCGSQNIVLNGRATLMTDVTVRGDLAHVRIGKLTVLRERCVIRPPFKKFSKGTPSHTLCTTVYGLPRKQGIYSQRQ